METCLYALTCFEKPPISPGEPLKFTHNVLIDILSTELSENRSNIQGTDARFCSSPSEKLN